MIFIYEQGYNDFSSNGLGTLFPARCIVKEEQGGAYELELEHPMDAQGVFDLLKNGRVIKAPVPAQTTPMHRIKGVAAKEYWTASDRKSLYSVKSTNTGYMETVTRTKKPAPPKAMPKVAVYRALGRPVVVGAGIVGQQYTQKPQTYTEDVWVPGPSRVLTTIPQGEEFLVLDKTDPTWLQVAAKNGTEGFIQRSGTSHSRTVPGIPDEVVQEKKIRDQLFRIYRVEKDTDGKEVKAWARHVYYDLLGNVLMDALYETVDLEELLPQLEVNCSQPDHGFRFFTDEPALEVNDLDYTHKNMVEAHLDPEEGLLNKGNLRMVRDNFSVYFTGRSQLVRAPITYGRNLLGVSLEINEDAVVNRIIPLGQDKDGEPVLIDQKWVDSPNLQDGDLIRAKAIEYSEAREKEPREATENSPGEPGVSIADVKQMLLDLANEEYEKGIDLPEIELEVDFIQLGDTEEYAQYRELDRLYLSDLVQITDLTHGIDVEAEVTEYQYDCLTSRYTRIKVGVTSASRTIGSVDGFLLPNGGVAGTKIARGGVDASRLANLSITSAKIGVAQIQLAHIADGNITNAKIANGTIENAKIKDATIETAKIKDAAITTAKIADAQVTNAKIANATIETAKIKDAAITTAKIQDAQITNAKIASAGIDYANIKDVSAGTAIFTQGVGQTLYLGRLIVTDANFSSAIIGKLMIRDTDGKLYRINVASDGAVTATQVQVNGDTLTDNAVMSVSQRLLWRQATAPSAPWIGMLWHDTTLDQLKRCLDDDPLTWEIVPSGAVHTSVIDVDDTGMTVATSGILNLLSGASLAIKSLDGVANVINMDNTGLTLSSTGQLKLQSTDSIIIGGSPFSVGGTNLFQNAWLAFPAVGTTESFAVTAWATDITYTGIESYFTAGETYTISYKVLNNTARPVANFFGQAVGGLFLRYGSTYIPLVGTPVTEIAQWEQREVKSTIIWPTMGSGAAFVFYTQRFDDGTVCNFSVNDFKIEKGTMATDWSPSPQDTVDALDGIGNQIGGLQTQVDGKIESWWLPTASDPSVNWTTSELKTAHTGDMWYNTTTKKLARWNGTAWESVIDQGAVDAYTLAETAKDTADGKRRVFTTTPVPPYDEGDLWAGGASGDLKRCSQAKAENESYASGDWVLATKYTDDTAYNTFAATTLPGLQARVQVFYQASKPTYTAVGDLWYDTDSNPLEVWKCTNVSTQAHSAFTDPVLTRSLSAATNAKDIADSKITTFVGDTTPTALAAGDLWMDTGNKNIWKRATAAGTGGWVQYLTAAGYLITTGITIDGTDLTVKATGNLNLATDGNLNVQNGGNLNVLNGGDIEISNGGDINVASGGKINVSATDLIISGQTVETYASDKIRLEVSVGVRNYYKRDQPFYFWSVPGSSPAMNVIREGYEDCEYGFFVMGSNPAAGSGMRISNVIDSNGWWTVSFDIRGTQSLPVAFYVDICDQGRTQIVTTSDNTFKRVSVSVNVTNYGTNPAAYHFVDFEDFYYAYFRIRNIKIEKGNKATDFIPANEDPASGVKTSYIDIATDHIDISTGGNLSLTGGNFNLTGGSGTKAIGMSTNHVDEYMMWAGNATPASAPFSVKRDGSVRATKVQQEYSNSFWDMADGSTPAEFPVYIPSGYTIDSVTFTFKTNKARTFAKAASSGGAFTTPAGDWLTGGVKDSVSTGTPSANNTGSASPSVSGFSGGVGTGSAGDSAHTHGSGSYTAASHSHGPGSHTHTMGHQHSISAHTHEINAHSHGLNYGINEKTTLATSCVLKVGATTIGTYSPNPSAPVEIKAYMVAGWNTVTVAPNDDARIVAYAMVKLTPS